MEKKNDISQMEKWRKKKKKINRIYQKQKQNQEKFETENWGP